MCITGVLDGKDLWKSLDDSVFGFGKNIFKKVVKIPPGELQTRGRMIKYRDDIKVVGSR